METSEIAFKLEGSVLFPPSERCLYGADGSVAILTENNLRFLLLLLNGVTEKEEIINQVWKEQRGAVSESSYYGQLYMLRKAFLQVGLKESLIRTIPRKGVQYTGNVTRILWSDHCEKIEEKNHIEIKNNTQKEKKIIMK
ncbi:putative transcriptional regulator [Candidatus Hamiltonella defensa 5AT (Acyrthosiphon pisum)]|uniref:Transcriptional regulator n=1 Tax=Hamiltonella defensa subsp. Acyrthosiphon pisum (strain 5AT) TaxID=572265 RepID=C4K496_HAMD5|nr:putative transcriptional regulator [Candidatus Hamiltonella defensa 5AT (Acyrthosiphon pisum)]